MRLKAGTMQPAHPTPFSGPAPERGKGLHNSLSVILDAPGRAANRNHKFNKDPPVATF